MQKKNCVLCISIGIIRDSKFGFENKYTAYELGYDQVTKRTADKTRYQGVGLSYTTVFAATKIP